jgi:hypothetical protein
MADRVILFPRECNSTVGAISSPSTLVKATPRDTPFFSKEISLETIINACYSISHFTCTAIFFTLHKPILFTLTLRLELLSITFMTDDETSSYTIYCDVIPEDKRRGFESLFMEHSGLSMTFKYEKALTMKLARHERWRQSVWGSYLTIEGATRR